MVSKLFIIGAVVVIGLWAAYFLDIGGIRQYVDSIQHGNTGYPGPPVRVGY